VIRIAVVEDDERYARQLCRYLETYEKEQGCPVDITCYSDGDLLVEQYRSQFDIILLDIDMPLMDGFTAAECIRKLDQAVILIFITNMAQHAIRGYAVDAMDYLLKDVSYETFAQRLGRAVARVPKRETAYLSIPVKGGVRRIEVQQIYYVESQGHQLVFHTSAGEIQSSGTMRETEELLKGCDFFRCHNGYLVNLRYVEGMQDGCALVQGEQLLISRPRRAAFLEALAQYL
jgi:DNA-binding LytR/AlgR family response regulator